MARRAPRIRKLAGLRFRPALPHTNLRRGTSCAFGAAARSEEESIHGEVEAGAEGSGSQPELGPDAFLACESAFLACESGSKAH